MDRRWRGLRSGTFRGGHGAEHEPVEVRNRERCVAMFRGVKEPHVDEFGTRGAEVGRFASHHGGDAGRLLLVRTEFCHRTQVGAL